MYVDGIVEVGRELFLFRSLFFSLQLKLGKIQNSKVIVHLYSKKTKHIVVVSLPIEHILRGSFWFCLIFELCIKRETDMDKCRFFCFLLWTRLRKILLPSVSLKIKFTILPEHTLLIKLSLISLPIKL